MYSIGLRRSFPWIFTIAQVKTSILGADFLSHFCEQGYAISRRWQHRTNVNGNHLNLQVNRNLCSNTRREWTTRVDKKFQLLLHLLNILMKFVTLLNIILQPLDHPHMHNHASPRRLHPEKYKIAKDEFQHVTIRHHTSFK